MRYLRLPRKDFDTLSGLCRPIELSKRFFPAFRVFLLDALGDTSPALTACIAGLRIHQLRLLYNRLCKVRGDRPVKTESGHGLTTEESTALAAACAALSSGCHCRHHVRDFLVLHFEKALPALGKKLARLSRSQFDWLCAQVSEQQQKRD